MGCRREPARINEVRIMRNCCHSCRERNPQRRGVALVEAALVLNIFLLFVFALFEYGRFVMQMQLLFNAAREGARYATVSSDTATTGQIQNYVTSFLAGQVPGNLVINVYQADPNSGANIGPWNTASVGNSIAVEITGNYQPMLPINSILPKPVPLSAKCTTYCEAK
jgi:Flp pilus assembly protein TadG